MLRDLYNWKDYSKISYCAFPFPFLLSCPFLSSLLHPCFVWLCVVLYCDRRSATAAAAHRYRRHQVSAAQCCTVHCALCCSVHCTDLHSCVLNWSVLWCTEVYCVVCVALYWTKLCCGVLCCTILYYTSSHSAVPTCITTKTLPPPHRPLSFPSSPLSSPPPAHTRQALTVHSHSISISHSKYSHYNFNDHNNDFKMTMSISMAMTGVRNWLLKWCAKPPPVTEGPPS